ncbi:gamma-crystallin M2-like protein [Lates japonicus]|uniref:Gamma-crystallin M2-like protein n=1 Tax=Lates japonicus TaxID=270547 RepID=A0AAD3NFD2_LATJO|nr:gamma-crystallin M2-like protein [Lates japonicus]
MSATDMNMMSRIIFYEDRNFQGRSYECSSDCADMSSYLSRCHSCRVERGCFMVYDRTNFMGNQYFLRRGEYADYMSMMGMNDCIRSCRMIPMYRGSYRMRIYERENFGGQMYELMNDCDNIHGSLPHVQLHVMSRDGRTLADVRAAPLQRQDDVHEAWRLQVRLWR